MTWQVSPEEWLLDFTTIPRGRVRGGESLDPIDDRLRTLLSVVPQAGLVMPAITATRAPARPPPPVRADAPRAEAIRAPSAPVAAARRPPTAPVPDAGVAAAARPSEASPVPEARRREPSRPVTAAEPVLVLPPLSAEPRAPEPERAEPRSTLEVQLLPPAATPSPEPASDAAPMVIPTLTRGNFHIDVDDETEVLDRLNPVGVELGIPRDDAEGEDVMSALAAATPVMTPEHPEEVIDDHEVVGDEDFEPETIDADPEPSVRIATPPPPAERPPPPAPDKPAADKPDKPVAPPPPPEKASPPPPPEKAVPPPPPEKAAKPPTAPPPPAKSPSAPLPAASAASGARKRGWYDEAFGEHYANVSPLDADASAEADAVFIRKVAELSAGMSLLDVGCGDGRHCFALANLGLMVTGLDNSLAQLIRAAQRNEATEAGITLLQGDMRSLPRDRTYDVVTCLGSTLGYFESEEQNRQTLQELTEVLRPGGKLVLHVFNRDYLVAVMPCRSWWQGRGCLVLDVADMNYFTNRMRVHRTIVFEDGRQFEHHMYIRAFSLHELGKMLSTMGMRVLEVSGSRDTRGRFYGATSSEIWIVAQRREDL
jgi:SAM-dependent methyltransferase